MGVLPNHPCLDGICPEINHPAIGYPHLQETSIYIYIPSGNLT